MDRGGTLMNRFYGGFPHTRGDGPRKTFFRAGYDLFSPHAWGWTEQFPVETATVTVFPTRVGMDRQMEMEVCK